MHPTSRSFLFLDERRLSPAEKPLLVQLNWLKDDREGRFLLKRDSERRIGFAAAAAAAAAEIQSNGGGDDVERPIVKRRVSSKKERKDSKKNKVGGTPATATKTNRPSSVDDTAIGLITSETAAAATATTATEGGGGSAAGTLYEQVPETSLTRSLSNPEAVMRRRREQKFEKKLESFKSKAGSGGLLRIYAESIKPDGPYKTLLLSVKDRVTFIIKESLNKFGLGRENVADYCLVMSSMSTVGAKTTWHGGIERVLEDRECPLQIKQEWSSTKYAEPTFHLRKRPFVPRTPVAASPSKKTTTTMTMTVNGGGAGSSPFSQTSVNESHLPVVSDVPYLIEVTPEGHMTPDAIKFKLQSNNVTQVGSERARTATGAPVLNLSQMLLPFNDIQPRHCKLANMSGVVTLTPLSPQAQTFVGGERIHETTLLQNRSVIVFGKSHAFMYIDPRQGRLISATSNPRPVNGDVQFPPERTASDRTASSSQGDAAESTTTSSSSRPASDQAAATAITRFGSLNQREPMRTPVKATAAAATTSSPTMKLNFKSPPPLSSDGRGSGGLALRTSWSADISGEKVRD